MSDADHGNHTDVLSLADEFIKRRRSQLDSAVIDSPRALANDDDIPVLTEVVPTTAAGHVAIPGLAPLPPLSMSTLNADITKALDQWLDQRLPQLVAYALDGAADKLILQIHQSAEQELLPRLNRALRGDTSVSDDD